jgi:hypothetical protein
MASASPEGQEHCLRGSLGAAAKARWPASPHAKIFSRALVEVSDAQGERGEKARVPDNCLAWSLDLDPANLRRPARYTLRHEPLG